jgi:hypothetical protein
MSNMIIYKNNKITIKIVATDKVLLSVIVFLIYNGAVIIKTLPF